jgi:hypothetical protein
MASQPKPVDPYKQADAQNQQNAYSAFYNSVSANANTNNPYGSTTSTVSGYIPYTTYDAKGRPKTTQVPQFTQNTTLSPQQQALFDQENQIKLGMGGLANQQIGQLKSTLGTPFNTEGLADWQRYGEGPDLQYEKGGTDRAAIEKAMMDSYYRGVKPQQGAEDAQYAARGMGAPGSKYGYNVANQRGDAAAEQTRQAYLGSGQESRTAMEAVNKALQQNWNNANQRVDQSNAQRQAEFGERQQTRNQLVNEVSALMGGGQAVIPDAPSWQGGQVNPFDIAGAQNNAYNIASQNATNKNNAIFGALGSVMGAFNPLGRMFG